jgi:hypothetical protein
MINIKEELKKDIKKLVGNLRSEEQLKEILKRRLTKKEFKFYKLKIASSSEDEMMKELLCDSERLAEIQKQTILKLNQEKIKRDLVTF